MADPPYEETVAEEREALAELEAGIFSKDANLCSESYVLLKERISKGRTVSRLVSHNSEFSTIIIQKIRIFYPG